MVRFSPLLPVAGVLLLLSGCAGPSLIATSAHWQGTPRAAPRHAPAAYHDRVAYDVDDYVDFLGRRLHLSRRQEVRIRRDLERRTHHLLERTHPRDRRYVYPFPRRFEHERNRAVARWWDHTDRRIERLLTHRQRAEYRYLTDRRDHRDRRYHRGRRY